MLTQLIFMETGRSSGHDPGDRASGMIELFYGMRGLIAYAGAKWAKGARDDGSPAS
jgi:hypothetical protein